MHCSKALKTIALTFICLGLFAGPGSISQVKAGTAEPLTGQISLFAGNFAPTDWDMCDGPTLAISQYEALYSIALNNFGSSHYPNFMGPNLVGQTPLGASGSPGGTGGNQYAQLATSASGAAAVQTYSGGTPGTGQYSLGNQPPITVMSYTFATDGIYPKHPYGNSNPAESNDMAGAIIGFMGDYIPDGYLACDGSAVEQSAYSELYGAIGATFGNGDGNGTSFSLPNLVNRVPLGAGVNEYSGAEYTLGQSGGSQYATQGGDGATYEQAQSSDPSYLDVMPAYQEITWAISAGQGAAADDYYYGTILPWASSTVPDGWALCDGQLLAIGEGNNDVLYSIIGAYYGGDGITDFALPDLRGRIPVGYGTGNYLGQESGSIYPAQLGASSDEARVQTSDDGISLEAMPPYQTLNYIICVQDGIYPARPD